MMSHARSTSHLLALKKPLRSVLVPQAGFEPASPQITQLPYTPVIFHSFTPKENSDTLKTEGYTIYEKSKCLDFNFGVRFCLWTVWFVAV